MTQANDGDTSHTEIWLEAYDTVLSAYRKEQLYTQTGPGGGDNGYAITGRGSPWTRGIVCGLMTTIGGLGHTLPYLIPDFWTATATAAVIVAIELAVISWIRYKYMETPIISALVQVLFGGALVLLVGILIGNA